MRRSTELPIAVLFAAGLLTLVAPGAAYADREAVLRQIALPHSYYYREMYLPQVTSGPSSVSWSPDGRELVYSMQGSLWRQALDSTTAVQISAGPGYDFQPDWSPDGKRIVFAKYFNDAIELHLLDLATAEQTPLTEGGAVNVEPRWSPDGARIAWVSTEGTGHFHVFTGSIANGRLSGRMLRPERKSEVARYYYSPFDHELSPSWSPDGKELLFIANPETRYGTGGLWRMNADGSGEAVRIHNEETTWKARPDWSPDGRRVIWSSYAGRQWHQLWATTVAGGDPTPLSYGEFDITSARWSRDAARIAYLSNESGDTAIWIQDIVGGARRAVEIRDRRYLKPMGELRMEVRDGNGRRLAARIAVTGPDGRAYAPDDAWIHADDGYDRGIMPFEIHYFHSDGNTVVTVPAGEAQLTVWYGLEHRVTRRTVHVEPGRTTAVALEPERLPLPEDWPQWQGGDVHLHMNYGGAYRNTPERLVRQMAAEDLDVVYNLVVNKEQRIPDIAYFSTRPDPASNADVLLLHAQEFHTSLWGHLGLLGLDDHFLLPDYSAYEGTAAASPYPSNAVVADLAHQQNALVGYVHPFDVLPAPVTDAALANSLPVDAALGKVDYYEVVGFSDHRASAEVWHRLLNCGFRLSAAAGTDAMANFASLRGPVGVNR
ncbi:MAG: CehA/McbA family metallohydrolase, partial [Gammaproteobacteria bacterium]|nr:CehA/McbA family metallohydrolase [Gammaproteobacteria bacterium]